MGTLKGQKEIYTQLNAEFQRIARKDKKAFLSEQARKQRKAIEWKRLEISSRELRDRGNISHTDGYNKGQKR